MKDKEIIIRNSMHDSIEQMLNVFSKNSISFLVSLLHGISRHPFWKFPIHMKEIHLITPQRS